MHSVMKRQRDAADLRYSKYNLYLNPKWPENVLFGPQTATYVACQEYSCALSRDYIMTLHKDPFLHYHIAEAVRNGKIMRNIFEFTRFTDPKSLAPQLLKTSFYADKQREFGNAGGHFLCQWFFFVAAFRLTFIPRAR